MGRKKIFASNFSVPLLRIIPFSLSFRSFATTALCPDALFLIIILLLTHVPVHRLTSDGDDGDDRPAHDTEEKVCRPVQATG